MAVNEKSSGSASCSNASAYTTANHPSVKQLVHIALHRIGCVHGDTQRAPRIQVGGRPELFANASRFVRISKWAPDHYRPCAILHQLLRCAGTTALTSHPPSPAAAPNCDSAPSPDTRGPS